MTGGFPHDDSVAAGVLETVEERIEADREELNRWAEEAGVDGFYEILDDRTGDAAAFFAALAVADDPDDDPTDEIGGQSAYEKHVGPAVDRIEEAFLDSLRRVGSHLALPELAPPGDRSRPSGLAG
jgi:hypothetical protein